MKRFIYLAIALLACLVPALAQAQTPSSGADLWDRAAYGSVPGVAFVRLEGNNGAVTTTLEPVWPESSAYTFLTGNMSSPTISSTSANDTAAGTGARTVTVTCVDSTYTVTTGTYSLNGQTGVNVTQNCMTVNSMVVATAGSGGVAAGSVYVGTGLISGGKPTIVHGIIAAGVNKTQSFIYAVPANKSLICRQWYASSISTTAGGHVVAIDTSTNAGLIIRANLPGYANTNEMFLSDYEILFPAKTQLMMQISASAGTGPVYANANCLLIDASSSNPNQVAF